jgi:hypothetical protein
MARRCHANIEPGQPTLNDHARPDRYSNFCQYLPLLLRKFVLIQQILTIQLQRYQFFSSCRRRSDQETPRLQPLHQPHPSASNPRFALTTSFQFLPQSVFGSRSRAGSLSPSLVWFHFSTPHFQAVDSHCSRGQTRARAAAISISHSHRHGFWPASFASYCQQCSSLLPNRVWSFKLLHARIRRSVPRNKVGDLRRSVPRNTYRVLQHFNLFRIHTTVSLPYWISLAKWSNQK